MKVHELVDTYRTTLEGKYKIANASDTDLVMYIAELRDESDRWKKRPIQLVVKSLIRKCFWNGRVWLILSVMRKQ